MLRDWCWSWNSNILATSCEELTQWKRPWCWVGLGAGGEGDNRGWDGWKASLTRWTWVWVNSGSWWWTGRPGVLWLMGSQRAGHDWATELNWCLFFSLVSWMLREKFEIQPLTTVYVLTACMLVSTPWLWSLFLLLFVFYSWPGFFTPPIHYIILLCLHRT